MITELVILVEGVIMGRVYEQTDRGGTLSFQYDPGWIELKDAFPLSVSMPLMKRHTGSDSSRPFCRICCPRALRC
jgi:HipA-like protein